MRHGCSSHHIIRDVWSGQFREAQFLMPLLKLPLYLSYTRLSIFLYFISVFGFANGILVPWTGLNPWPLQWKCRVNHWTTREVPTPLYCNFLGRRGSNSFLWMTSFHVPFPFGRVQWIFVEWMSISIFILCSPYLHSSENSVQVNIWTE